MKRTTTKLLLLWALVCTGCITEDLSRCPRVYRLELSYLGDGTTELFDTKIGHVKMYVYDGTDACVESREATSSELASRTLTLTDYPQGNYRVVCLGNARNTMVTDPSACGRDEMRFADPGWFTGERISTNDSLYYAAADIAVTGSRTERGILRFASSHYKLYVEVSGFDPQTRALGIPRLELHGVRPATDFANQSREDLVTYYLTTTPYDAATRKITSLTSIMRHIDDSTELELLDSDGNHLASVHLPTFLADHEEIDLTKHEVLIPIAFRFKETDVEITVPDWYVEDIQPEI